jgi:hypothetical protein
VLRIERKGEKKNTDNTTTPKPEGEKEEEGWDEPKKNEMPEFFANHLKGICRHCECKKEILWRNFQRAEQHFDACFRYFDEQKESAENSQQFGDPQGRNGHQAKYIAEDEDNIVYKPVRQDSLGKQEPHNKCFLKRLWFIPNNLLDRCLP